MLGNTPDEVAAAKKAGFRAAWVHHNCWLDERLFQPLGLPKQYRAVMVTQPAVDKRPWLASEVPGLAIVAGRPFAASGIDLEAIPHAAYVTDVASAEVCRIINQSEVGLILSEEEGGCFASSEYLMCGIPVVSTPSRGGRDTFYDTDNRLIVEPSAADVARGVVELASRRLDAVQISGRHLERAREFARHSPAKSSLWRLLRSEASAKPERCWPPASSIRWSNGCARATLSVCCAPPGSKFPLRGSPSQSFRQRVHPHKDWQPEP